MTDPVTATENSEPLTRTFELVGDVRVAWVPPGVAIVTVTEVPDAGQADEGVPPSVMLPTLPSGFNTNVIDTPAIVLVNMLSEPDTYEFDATAGVVEV